MEIRFGILLRKICIDTSHVRLRLSDADSRLQAAYHRKEIGSALGKHFGVIRARRPKLHRRRANGKSEFARSDTDDRVALIVQDDGAANDMLVRAELRAPQTIA